MTDKQISGKEKKEYIHTLKQYVPVVARVHGKSHPEFHEVKALFDAIIKKMSESEADWPELEQEFIGMRDSTKNYTVPDDVCETYEAVYRMLETLDHAYGAKMKSNE